jgi:membrane fusion protein (multidrug efflux system)
MRVPLRVYVRRLVNFCFLLAILALIPVFLSLQMKGASHLQFTGVVESESETVGAVEPSRILSIDVQPGQSVKPGDVLVRLDPADRAMDLALQAARLKDYEQNALRYDQGAARYRQTLEESERRCRQALQEAAVELETEKMNLARDEAELAGLKAEIQRLQPLIDKRLVSEVELSSIRPKAQALEQTIQRYSPLIGALQRRHEAAGKDLLEVQSLLAAATKETLANPLKDSLQQAEQACAQAAKSEPSVLRASRAGVVSRIQRQPGDVVVAGEPIVRVASVSSLYITGLLTQSQLASIAPGEKLAVRRMTGSVRTTFAAQVESVEPEVLDLLDPFNPSPRFPMRGRRVRLRLLDEAPQLVPGEAVTFHQTGQESWLDTVRRTCFFSESRPPSL